MIKFRNNSEVLINGSFKEEVVSNSIISFYRKLNDKVYLIVCNFSSKTKKYSNILNLKLLISNYKKKVEFTNVPQYYAGIFEIV